MRVIILTILSVFCFVAITFAQETTSIEQALKAQEQKQYQTAIDQYEAILQTGEHSESLYFNLGNCYLNNRQLGKAILNYERVLLLDANDTDALHNLAVARQQLKDEIGAIPTFFLKKWWTNLRSITSTNVWAILGVLFFWLGIGGLAFWQMGKDRTQRKKGFFGGMVLLLFSLLPIFLALSASNHMKNSKSGIILVEEIALRTGPDKQSQEIVVIHEGTKVEIMDLIDSWYKVRLANGEKGWLAAGSFEKI